MVAIVRCLFNWPFLQPFDTITATICEGEAYTFGGADLSTTGIYVDTLQGPTGCESIVQLELSVLPAFETIISEVICEGDTLVTANLALYENGTYTDTLAAINGCDSMLLIDLTVHPAPRNAPQRVYLRRRLHYHRWPGIHSGR
jgi:hypothetical protein